MTTYVSPQGYLESEQNYQQQRVEQASPLELTCILYEGAIQAVEQAQIFLKRGDILARGRAVARAQGILVELTESLDRKQGGDFAARLGLLYDYMLAKLTEAHAQQLVEPLVEVRQLLVDLHSAWREIAPAPGAVSNAEPSSGFDLAG
ncbi:MAG: flagellar export chaperone FliS [Acidobacteria bacterium]|nr:flagellar export chaperone FliS [Acidobacteriota bacterium]